MLDFIKDKIRRLKYEYWGLIELNKKSHEKEEKLRRQNERVLWQGRYHFKKLEILNVPCIRTLYFQMLLNGKEIITL